MRPEDRAKLKKEIADLEKDLQDIADVTLKWDSGFGFDRDKAQEIIRKQNTSDTFVCALNNHPDTAVPLSVASDSTLMANLDFLRSYLSGKLLRKQEELSEGDHNPFGI